MDLVISDQNSKEEQYEELSRSTEPLKQAAHSLINVEPHEQIDIIVGVAGTEKELNKQNNTEGTSISKPCEAACYSLYKF
jgi:hypothetical protein